MHRKTVRSLTCLLLVCSLLTGLTGGIAATDAPEEAELVWDMETLPEELFAADIAWDTTSGEGGHTQGYTDATCAEGKGYGGSTAAALTFRAGCPASSFWSDGFYLRLDRCEGANTDWLGMEEFWFWLDISEFKTEGLALDLMIEGVHPELDKTFWLVQDGQRTEHRTAATYDGAVYGRLPLPIGFTGWVGIGAEAFNAFFGTVRNVAFTIAPTADAEDFPLSMYVDEFRIVRADTSASALHGEGERFNSGLRAQALLYTDMTDVYQTMQSYGASGAWWATAYGTADFVDTLLRLTYTDEGAGLNNYRHNIGGGVREDQSDTSNPGSGRSPYSPLTEDGRYEEDRDFGAYSVLMKLVEMGTIDDFTLFMNSPPATMTKSGMTNGDPWETSASNLREDCYEAYAEYVVDMVQLYHYLGVPVKYVSPINEPQYEWTDGAQEGCHYTPDEAMQVYRLVVEELVQRAQEDTTLQNVRLSLSESGTWYDKSYINYMYYQIMSDPLLTEQIDHIGSHSYGASAADKKRLAEELRNIGADIALHQTEYGPAYAQPDFTISSALNVARVMYEDISILNVDTWSYWLAAANGLFTDGLSYYNPNSSDLITSKRLWAMGNYARFTKGALRVGVDSYAMPEAVLTTAYYNTEERSLVYVMVNTGDEDVTFGFAGLPAGVCAEVYETSAIRDLALRGTMYVDDGYALPAQSVTTFVFRALEPESVQSEDHPDNPLGHPGNAEFDFAVYSPTESPEATEPTEPPVAPPQEKVDGGNWLPWIILGGALLLALTLTAVLLTRRKKKKE